MMADYPPHTAYLRVEHNCCKSQKFWRWAQILLDSGKKSEPVFCYWTGNHRLHGEGAGASYLLKDGKTGKIVSHFSSALALHLMKEHEIANLDPIFRAQIMEKAYLCHCWAYSHMRAIPCEPATHLYCICEHRNQS